MNLSTTFSAAPGHFSCRLIQREESAQEKIRRIIDGSVQEYARFVRMQKPKLTRPEVEREARLRALVALAEGVRKNSDREQLRSAIVAEMGETLRCQSGAEILIAYIEYDVATRQVVRPFKELLHAMRLGIKQEAAPQRRFRHRKN